MEGDRVEKNLLSVENGTMAANMEEIIELGRQMERMRDGKQLFEDERITDPIQWNDEEQDIDEDTDVLH